MAAGSQGVGEQWSSRTAFLLAAVGAAVGLGNIWRFPTLAGESGGGAFVLIYVLCVALIGLPLLLAETLIGRAGGHNADSVGSIAEVAELSGRSKSWSIFGGIGLVTIFLILSFYSVVAGWVLYYVWLSAADFLGSLMAGNPLAGAFTGMSQDQVTGMMGELFANPFQLILQHAIFMGLTLAIVAVGVTGGIERAAKWMMPGFFGLLILITIYSAFTGDFGAAMSFLFTPDFSKLSPAVINDALGQACFSLSVGGAILITYGSYVPRHVRLGPTAVMIAAVDTGVAIMAGLMIFPIVFSAGLDPAGGPGLIFQTLPVAFQQMPAGALVGFAFFILIFFAALSSSIALLEAPVAFVIRRFRIGRRLAASLVALAAFLIGVACALGYNVLSDVRPLWFWPTFADADILDSIDDITGKIGLPLAGLGVAIFTGWRASRRLVEAELDMSRGMFLIWHALVAWLAPVMVFLILLFGLVPSLLA
ncbi:sodium-dependent transporter [Alteraurantiacibacter aestuarii]|uniref:sodium-dependent transporter n=1 Tax=Alteraurantiacibacter aestuarii TaxID=650004 RepID=UPI0031E26CDE